MKRIIIAALLTLFTIVPATAGDRYTFDDEPGRTQEYEVRSRIGAYTDLENRRTGEKITIYDPRGADADMERMDRESEKFGRELEAIWEKDKK